MVSIIRNTISLWSEPDEYEYLHHGNLEGTINATRGRSRSRPDGTVLAAANHVYGCQLDDSASLATASHVSSGIIHVYMWLSNYYFVIFHCILLENKLTTTTANTKQNKTMCIFYGIYCMICNEWRSLFINTETLMLGSHIYAHKRLPDTEAVAMYVKSIHILNLIIDIGIEDSCVWCDWLSQSLIFH